MNPTLKKSSGYARTGFYVVLLLGFILNSATGDFFVDSGQRLGPEYTTDIALGDIDGDNDLDLIVGNYTNDLSNIYLNDGNGIFTHSGQTFYTTFHGLDLGDVNSDTYLDIVSGYVYLNDGNGNFGAPVDTVGGTTTYRIALGDLDGDNDLDAFVGEGWGNCPNVFLNDGTGRFNLHQTLPDDNGIAVALADFDGDNDLDAVVGRWPAREDKVYINDGSANFTDSGQLFGGNTDTYALCVGDIDGDNDIDIILGRDLEPNIVYLNDGSGNFTDSGQLLGDFYTHALVLADVDNDNDLDLCEGNTGSTIANNRLYLNNGSGVFTLTSELIGNYRTNDIDLGDLDGDTDVDMVEGTWFTIGGTSPETTYVYFNTYINATSEEHKPISRTNHLFTISPNPVGPDGMSISFVISNDLHNDVSLKIFDTSGRLITTLLNQSLAPGPHTFYWNRKSNSKCNQGVYFVRLKIGSKVLTGKLILL